MRHSVIVVLCGFLIVVGFVGLAFVGVPSWAHVVGVFIGGGFMIWGIFLEGSDNA